MREKSRKRRERQLHQALSLLYRSARSGPTVISAGYLIQTPENPMLRSNSLRSTEHKLFSLYTNTKSYKDNTVFHGLVAQAIKQLTLN